jgi:uncharacterized protein involved in outer membrane biogenesis
MKKLVKILIGLVIVLVLVGVVAILFIGTFVKAGVEKVGPMVTKTPVTLDSATISVFSGNGALKGFVVNNPDGFKAKEAIKVGTMNLGIEPGSIFKEKKHIKIIKVEGPEITYETGLTGSNLGKILDNVSGTASQDEKAPTKDQQTTKTKLQVDEFVITGGKINVGATMLGSATIPLPEIRLEKMGEGPDGITPAELSKKVLSAVLDATTKAVAANAGKLGDAGKLLSTGATDQLKKTGSGIGDLFKKKE